MLQDAVDGATSIGAAVGLKQNDAAALQASLTALVGDPTTTPPTPGLKDKWNIAKAAKTNGTAGVRTATSNGRAQAQMCMGVLKPVLGNQWNTQWQTAGFTVSSLSIPDNPMTLLQQISAYFTANPAQEVNTVTITATAAACTAAAVAIGNASNASNQSNTASGTAKKNLQDGIDGARARMTGLRDELVQLLPGNDPRWYSFGFDRPDDPTTPKVPQHVTVTNGSPGMLFVDFDDARNADSYRVTVFDTATPPNKVDEQLVDESEATFIGLPTGKQVKVVVSARNSSGGESAATAGIAATVP
jgi:hypothetical protein